METVEDFLELGLTVLMYACTMYLVVIFVSFSQINMSGFTEDKSMLTTTGVVYKEDNYLTGKDILMSLYTSDVMNPYPNAFKINDTPIIRLDRSFFSNKNSNIGRIYSGTGQHKLVNLLNHRSTSIKLVNDGVDVYWHIILEEVN